MADRKGGKLREKAGRVIDLALTELVQAKLNDKGFRGRVKAVHRDIVDADLSELRDTNTSSKGAYKAEVRL